MPLEAVVDRGGETTGPVERVEKLRSQYEDARRSAIEELLEKRRVIEKQLKALGHEETRGQSKRCGVCGAVGHNGRSCLSKARGSEEGSGR